MFIKRIFKRHRPTSDFVTVVSGLPRSGTSMMMQALRAGGLEAISDNARHPDINNVNGYYELESVKGLAKGDLDCLIDSKGKAIKIVSHLLKYIPPHLSYKIIFMRRDLDAVLASQRKMLLNLEKNYDSKQDNKLAKHYSTHINNVNSWLLSQKNIDVLELNYEEVLKNPQQYIVELEKFVLCPLDKVTMELTIDKNMNHHSKI